MSADLNVLLPELKSKFDRLLVACKARGVEMRPYIAVRSPHEQAILWRQSRSQEEIAAKIANLKLSGAIFLAKCIETVGPQNGPRVTNAIPGLSWHQWREAVDCFWIVNSEAEWSSSRLINGVNGYHVYAEEADRIGLTSGGAWTTFQDWPHIQLRVAASPLEVMNIVMIDKEMAYMYHG